VHELAITESMVAAVAEQVGDTSVRRVTLRIGRLSGVVADSVRFCFDLCAQGTPLEGATLEIVDVPGRTRCRTCGSEHELPDLIPLCPCGSADVDVVSGQDLVIERVEVLV
jgi:hydrogenase nickel incorporation protein HypA/HybF